MKKSLTTLALLAIAPAFSVSQAGAAPATSTATTPTTATKPVATTPKPTAAIAASVNNDKMLKADLDRAMAAIKASDKSLQSDSDKVKEALATLRQSQIDNWINNRLLLMEVARRRIVAPPADVNALMKTFRAQFKTTADYQAFLKSGNQTEAGLRKLYGERLALDELSSRLGAAVTVSPAEIQKFYDKPSDDFEIPDMARARHILLRVSTKATAEDKAKIRAQAEEILKKARVPNADFVALVKEFSQDPDAAKNLGDSGEFAQDEALSQMKPFADAVFASRTGDVIGVIETVFGFHIIKVEDGPHKPALNADLKDTIGAVLVREQVRKKLDVIIAQNRKTAKIQVNA